MSLKLVGFTTRSLVNSLPHGAVHQAISVIFTRTQFAIQPKKPSALFALDLLVNVKAAQTCALQSFVVAGLRKTGAFSSSQKNDLVFS